MKSAGQPPISAEIESRDAFEQFVRDTEPRLRRALAGVRGSEPARDGAAEAMGWAWENWERVRAMESPVSYLYRVGLSKTRRRREGHLPSPADLELPEVEPALVPALRALPPKQRAAVWLVHGCGWSYADAAEAMEIGTSTLGTHVTRGVETLREAITKGTKDA